MSVALFSADLGTSNSASRARLIGLVEPRRSGRRDPPPSGRDVRPEGRSRPGLATASGAHGSDSPKYFDSICPNLSVRKGPRCTPQDHKCHSLNYMCSLPVCRRSTLCAAGEITLITGAAATRSSRGSSASASHQPCTDGCTGARATATHGAVDHAMRSHERHRRVRAAVFNRWPLTWHPPSCRRSPALLHGAWPIDAAPLPFSLP